MKSYTVSIDFGCLALWLFFNPRNKMPLHGQKISDRPHPGPCFRITINTSTIHFTKVILQAIY